MYLIPVLIYEFPIAIAVPIVPAVVQFDYFYLIIADYIGRPQSQMRERDVHFEKQSRVRVQAAELETDASDACR